MKIKVLLFLISFYLVSCDDDEHVIIPKPVPDIDIESPVISVSVPANGESFIVIERVGIEAMVTDNKEVKEVNTYLTSEDLPDHRIPHSKVQYIDKAKRQMYSESMRLPLDIKAGIYKLHIEARDYRNNVSSHTVDIVIQDPDLDEATFSNTFLTIGLYSTLDWLGYAFQSQKGIEEKGLSFAFNLMADNDWDSVISQSEWNQFISDFYFQSLQFDMWDADKNKSLSNTEFKKAIDSLGLIQAWDLNKDGFLGEAEMGMGIFSRWDHNKNQFLSREEYHYKFRTQFHFAW